MARIADQELDRLKSEVSLVRLIESAGYTLGAALSVEIDNIHVL